MSTVNLREMIARSGMQKQEVAQMKGITPETLSRHISGKIQLTRRDADDYAHILDCKPQEILFQIEPMPVVGRWTINAAGKFALDWTQDKRGAYPKMYLSAHHHRENFAVLYDFTTKQLATTDVPMTPWWTPMKVDIVYGISRLKDVVDQEATMALSYARTATGKLIFGYVYPTPNYGLYNIHVPKTISFNDLPEIETQNIALDWACPIISSVIRPDLREMEIVEQAK